MKPIIGISGNILVNKTDTFSGYKRAYVNHDYVESVIRAGGVPVILPFNECLDATEKMVENIDALILSGGHDIDPNRYGEEPLLKIGEIFPKRDEFDSVLYKCAIKNKKPVFGICRGFQIINVINGGSLYQDLSYASFVTIKHNQVDNPKMATHFVEVENETFLGDVVGNKLRVNSFHHQIIKEVAEGFKIVAKSSDGVVEAIEKIDETNFVIGVQWHPEMLSEGDVIFQEIFNKFVEKARKN